MGITEGLEGGTNVEGTIVWVRRRNGSWWPGRILGPNELSDSHLMSPKSGTPVKLLGREDASVDWYNLEKSKRVKAFRCGEFDDCIERAESSHINPIKKREKYARREDAILHALELEKQQLERKQQKLGIPLNYMSNKMRGTSKKELDSCSPSENHLGNSGAREHFKFINLEPQLFSKKLDSSLKEEVTGDPIYTLKGKHAKQPSWEDDNSEAIPRMRGLQDFGLRIAPSKRNLSTSVSCENPRRSGSVDNHVHALPNRGHSMGGANHVGRSKSSSGIKGKRSQGGLTEESLVKRRGKEQVGVLRRAKRSKCVYLPVESNDCLNRTEFPSDQVQIAPSHFGTNNCLNAVSLTEQNACLGLVEESSDSSERDYLDSDTEEEEEAVVLSDHTQILSVPGPRRSEGYVTCSGSDFQDQGQPGSMSNDELDESALSGYMSHPHRHWQMSGISADMGGSKWQLKGKRNVRSLTKRPFEVLNSKSNTIEADKCNGSTRGIVYEGKGNILKTARMEIPSQRASDQGFYHRSEVLNSYVEGDLFDNDLTQTQMVGFGNRRYPLMLKASSRERGRSTSNITDSDEDSPAISPTVWEADRLSKTPLGGYWEETDMCFDPIYVGRLGDGLESMLVDVDLKVQASYQGERVPLVSLMSRLNGKAIIGHPIQIEALQDCSSDILLSTSGFSEEPTDDDGSAALPPVWRTGRRTAMLRVPRPHPSPALDGEEVDPLQYSDFKSNSPSKKSYDGHPNLVRLMKKSASQIRQPMTGKFQKKPLKKVSLSSQKTRTLSSFATQLVGGKKSDKNGDLDGSIKPEERAPSITCVPVKLVYSRILEAIGRPPSKAERKPS
ncbi:uncharacterized protein At1g51745-like isoform X2 [Tasmannia lanceolata]|uniref:uncharacterized protein At1g51745-like isoform X2 n=1 Tax=Tasmannia lanceolata TaxID=3420 RepID=UPI004062FADB